MGYLIETTRSEFFKELPKDLQKQYFGLKREKTISTIDNIYYTVFVTNDGKEDIPAGLQNLLEGLEESKAEAIKIHEPIEFSQGLYYLLKSYSAYGYCVGEPDYYDIFCCKTLPNDDTPRFVVQIRSFGLWTKNIEAMLEDSFSKVEALLAEYSCTVSWCRESRIDYCFHTNAISNISNLIKKDSRGKVKHMHTNLSKYKWNGDIKHEKDGTVHIDDYLAYGSRGSNNVLARIYNKVKEVIEQGYKGFFFKLWHEKGLISYYDLYCMEYAFPHKNMDYLAKAGVEFYAEHGTDPVRVELYKSKLLSPKTTLAEFKRLAEYLPKVTNILNIEYETKRKFYYNSDNFINGFQLTAERGNIKKPMERVYKILDYRDIFLNYLTSKTMSFHRGEKEDGELKFLPWWERLRNTKHDGKKVDGKLLREYSCAMDKKAVQKRLVNSLASNAVYGNRLETCFIADLSDVLADITDNQAHRMMVLGEHGEILEEVDSKTIAEYILTKAKKEKVLKNRKKRLAEKTAEADKEYKSVGDGLKSLYNRVEDNQTGFTVTDETELSEEWRSEIN
ncbi:MAG: hypothetical protein FWB96_00825 [Defluviitaleaceae bacterium]|nr:hypothetical protein [Defluviitaleaceae bacterium]MCL2262751.1 hypothetical protein [Defluviitaleaceae bacterium]